MYILKLTKIIHKKMELQKNVNVQIEEWDKSPWQSKVEMQLK
jgi:hypothetical protein